MTYFSDREQYYRGEKLSMQIPINVWNGVAMLVNSLIANNNLAKDFPRQCPDGNGICGVDEHSFYTSAKSVIPAINFLPEYGSIETLSSSFLEPNPFEDDITSQEHTTIQFSYNVLDFIEFVFKHLCDVQNGQYHDYFKHYELTFPSTTNTKGKYISDINEIFSRNNIAFKINDNGEIQRILDEELNNLIASTNEPTEETLSSLLRDATTKIVNPKIEERKIALERLWDAFERLKSIINPDNKKDSANQLLDKVSHGNENFKDILATECLTSLTKIGNEFQIRHFETTKIAIEDSRHLDYLFFRMYALIHLLLTEI
jgi:hypothetical protein